MFQTIQFGKCLNRRTTRLAPIFLLVATAFAQSPAGVPNFHVVNDHIYRGAQPSFQGFQSLARMGVKTVIDLRSDEVYAEKQQVESLGMRFVSIPMHGMETPSEASVQKALALFNDPSSGRVFVHCRRGADRTGAVVACYRISHDRWQNQRALDEAKTYGMAWVQRQIQHYVMNFRGPVENAAAPPAVPPAAPVPVPEQSLQPGGGSLN